MHQAEQIRCSHFTAEESEAWRAEQAWRDLTSRDSTQSFSPGQIRCTQTLCPFFGKVPQETRQILPIKEMSNHTKLTQNCLKALPAFHPRLFFLLLAYLPNVTALVPKALPARTHCPPAKWRMLSSGVGCWGGTAAFSFQGEGSATAVLKGSN